MRCLPKHIDLNEELFVFEKENSLKSTVKFHFKTQKGIPDDLGVVNELQVGKVLHRPSALHVTLRLLSVFL